MTLHNFRFVFLAALLAILISPLAMRLANKLGLQDRPDSEPHKKHTQSVPLAGGLVIGFVLLVLGGFSRLVLNTEVGAILIAGGVVLIFGGIDDRWSLSPLWKLLSQILASVVVISLGIRVHLFHQELLNIAVTMLWMVGITNAVNFVDSMDGLAAGLAGVAAGFFMLVAFDSGQLDLSAFSAILVGVCAGVYYFTALPARYFLGDSGAQFLGFILAGLAIAYNPVGFLPTQSWFIPIMLIGVPIFDTALVIISRIRRRQPIYRSGRDHTYHRLVRLGMHPNRAVVTMHFAAILLGCLAFIALAMQPLVANILFAACLILAVTALVFMEKWAPKN
jgi:UDP-GlcNAc:undecaprenyl-phosphate/decaprenyl-phosphate GlcNAc-1-phosphate transferase